MDEIRIAVVGLGNRGVFSWLGMLQHVPGYRVVARLAQPDDVRVYRDYADVLADPRVDAVAPAILAATSIERHSALQAVPDFRPGPARPAGRALDASLSTR